MSHNFNHAVFAALVGLAIPLSATAASAESVATQAHYSTETSTVGELLANPQTRAILETQFPGVSSDWRMKFVKGKTFRKLNSMNPKKVPAAKLDIVDAELAKVRVAR